MKIVVFCCDRYADIAPAWLACQAKFWADCPYETVFVTNHKQLDVDSTVYYVNEADKNDIDFGWRLRSFIRQFYSDDLILISMADYLIKHTDQTTIAQAEALCHRTDVSHVRLRPMPHPQLTFDVDGFGGIDKRKRYSLSLQPGIWKTSVLYNLCRDDEDPWQTEMRGSARARTAEGLFLSTDAHVLHHQNYYAKGRVTDKTKQWVRDNVPVDSWPKGIKC